MQLSDIGRDLLERASLELGISITTKLEVFEQLYALQQQAADQLNLTSIRDETGVILKHFIDSLTCLTSQKLNENLTVIDVGTGGGYPGLPLKIVQPDLEITFLDATRKKIEHIHSVCNQLKLHPTYFVWGRAEEIAHQPEHREHYDRAVIRAVSSLSAVCELCLPLVRVGGYVIAQKGPEVEAELKSAKKAAEILGGEIIETKTLQLPILGDHRTLVIIKKTSSTPKNYPRKAGIPAKKPLG